MSFRNDRQISQAMILLLRPVGMETYWTLDGPAPHACALVKPKGGLKANPLSHGQAIMLQVAFDFWNGDGHARIGSILATLDSVNLENIGTLLIAVRHGAVAIDDWINARGSARPVAGGLAMFSDEREDGEAG